MHAYKAGKWMNRYVLILKVILFPAYLLFCYLHACLEAFCEGVGDLWSVRRKIANAIKEEWNDERV
jgi:hypothetical protein